MALEATDEELRLASYGQRGTDLLLEAPYGPLPTSFEEQVFRLGVRGYRILLAHPERNPDLPAAIRRGWPSWCGEESCCRSPPTRCCARGEASRSRELARSLVAEGIAHVLASDAHGAARAAARDAARRRRRGAARSPAPYADWMTCEQPDTPARLESMRVAAVDLAALAHRGPGVALVGDAEFEVGVGSRRRSTAARSGRRRR